MQRRGRTGAAVDLRACTACADVAAGFELWLVGSNLATFDQARVGIDPVKTFLQAIAYDAAQNWEPPAIDGSKNDHASAQQKFLGNRFCCVATIPSGASSAANEGARAWSASSSGGMKVELRTRMVTLRSISTPALSEQTMATNRITATRPGQRQHQQPRRQRRRGLGHFKSLRDTAMPCMHRRLIAHKQEPEHVAGMGWD